MRLTADEVHAIKAAAANAFAPDAVVRLFGSRVDDTMRGGDIDLHLEVADGDQSLIKAANFRSQLYEMLKEQKVDLVFRVRGRPLRLIDEVAYADGVVL